MIGSGGRSDDSSGPSAARGEVFWLTLYIFNNNQRPSSKDEGLEISLKAGTTGGVRVGGFIPYFKALRRIGLVFDITFNNFLGYCS